MANRGINGGIDGIISLTEESIPSTAGTIVFNAKVNSYTGNLAARPIIRTGPGSNGIPKIRLADIRGGGSADGEFTWNGPPLPSTIQYATGSITYQLDDGCTISFAVKVSSVSFSHVEEGKGQDELFHCAFKWDLVGAVTVAWANGTPVTISAPSANDSPTYEGRAKSLDPQGIKSTATTRIDCEGVADDDVTQTAKIAALIGAASAPMANLKPISISCTQYEDDHNGIQVVTQFALQDSKDEIETPQNINTTDPNDLTSGKTLALVYTTGSPPSTPSAPSGEKLVDYADHKINDQLTFRLYRWAKKDSKDEVELPRTQQSVDSTSINSEGSIAELDGTPSVPGGYVLVSTVTEHPTTDHSVTTLKYALRTTAGGIEFDESEISTDPNDLVGYIVEAHVYTTLSGAPAPSPPTGFRTVTTSNKTINNLKSKTVFRYGKKDSKDELQLPATFTVSDTNNLGSYASVAVVDGSPSTPSGFTARTSKTQYIVDVSLSSGHTLTTNEYGLRSTADDLQMPGTWNRIDPSDLESEGIKTQVYTTAGGVPSAPTPPTGLVIVASRTTQENTIKSKAEWWFGKDTSIQKWVNAHSETMTDPSNVASTQTTAAIDGTPPALDAGFYDRGIRQIQITHDHTGQIREGGKRYTEDDIIMPATSSFRSALAPYRDSIAQLLNSSASDQSVADAQWATFQSIANAYAVRVRSINREEKLLVFEYLNPGIQVIASTRGGGRIVPARINSGTAQVFVARKRSIDGTRYKYTLRSKYIQSAPIRQFTIVRLLSGTTIPEHATLIGQTNDASFLGLSSGTCLYIGDEAVTNISLSGTFPFMMYYHFWSDAIGIFDYEGRRDEEFVSTSSTPAEGWTAASGFASNEVNIIKPTQADFSVFIT